MIEVVPTEAQIAEAMKMAEEMGTLNKSITKGAGNVAGFLGEIVLRDLKGLRQQNTYDYDLISNSGVTYDVKTKRTTRTPLPHYECSVAAYNTKQQCDYYIFARVMNDLSKVWILGGYKKDDFYEHATFHKKDEIDKDNDFTFTADCYNMKISDLKRLQ